MRTTTTHSKFRSPSLSRRRSRSSRKDWSPILAPNPHLVFPGAIGRSGARWRQQSRRDFAAVAAGTALGRATLVDMGVFLFIGGVTAVAGGSIAALYYLVGPPSEQRRNKAKERPGKRPLLSHWR